MSYESFKNIVNDISDKAKINENPDIFEDFDKGLYIAIFPSGIKITGSKTKFNLTVRWGSGHQAMVPLRAL